jgi:hypothetical protein
VCICYRAIILYTHNFVNEYDINTLRMSYFYTTLCGQVKDVLHMWMCSLSTTFTSGWNNPHAIRKRGYEVRFSFSTWAGIDGDTATGPYLLPDRLIAQRHHDFLGTVLSGMLEDVPLAVGPRL